jgi:hypothetical protein
MHEWSFVFVTTSIYSLTAYIARSLFGEKPTEISKYQMLTLSVTSIGNLCFNIYHIFPAPHYIQHSFHVYFRTFIAIRYISGASPLQVL